MNVHQFLQRYWSPNSPFKVLQYLKPRVAPVAYCRVIALLARSPHKNQNSVLWTCDKHYFSAFASAFSDDKHFFTFLFVFFLYTTSVNGQRWAFGTHLSIELPLPDPLLRNTRCQFCSTLTFGSLASKRCETAASQKISSRANLKFLHPCAVCSMCFSLRHRFSFGTQPRNALVRYQAG